MPSPAKVVEHAANPKVCPARCCKGASFFAARQDFFSHLGEAPWTTDAAGMGELRAVHLTLLLCWTHERQGTLGNLAPLLRGRETKKNAKLSIDRPRASEQKANTETTQIESNHRSEPSKQKVPMYIHIYIYTRIYAIEPESTHGSDPNRKQAQRRIKHKADALTSQAASMQRSDPTRKQGQQRHKRKASARAIQPESERRSNPSRKLTPTRPNQKATSEGTQQQNRQRVIEPESKLNKRANEAATQPGSRCRSECGAASPLFFFLFFFFCPILYQYSDVSPRPTAATVADGGIIHYNKPIAASGSIRNKKCRRKKLSQSFKKCLRTSEVEVFFS